jgi:hypothetical protein
MWEKQQIFKIRVIGETQPSRFSTYEDTGFEHCHYEFGFMYLEQISVYFPSTNVLIIGQEKVI